MLNFLNDNSFAGLGKDKTLDGLPQWAYYTLGSLFLALSLACFALYPNAVKKSQKYKEEQIKEYIKQKRINEKVKIDYNSTKMFLPPKEKAKLFMPVFFGLVFLLLGIAFMIQRTLFS